MSNLKHTPGTWIYEHKRFLDKFLIISEVGNILASINNNSYEIPVFEQEANAKLMAAAPDLLDAALKASEILEYGECAGTNKEAFELLFEAIKKATV